MTCDTAPLLDGTLIDALARPCGRATDIDRLKANHLAHWQRELRTGGNRALAEELPSRHDDPIFMAWMIETVEARGSARLGAVPSQGPTAPSASLPLVGLADCPALARLLQPTEHPTTLQQPIIATEIAKSLDLIERVWPEALQDVRAFAGALFVLELPPGRFSSGSDANLPYVVKVTCQPGAWPALLADSLIHETAHVKLRMAMRYARFLDDDETPRYRHPWRIDKRPLLGVLLAAHAFVSVFTLYARLAAAAVEGARQEAQRLESEVSHVLQILGCSHGLTPLGRSLSDRLSTVFDDERRPSVT